MIRQVVTFAIATFALSVFVGACTSAEPISTGEQAVRNFEVSGCTDDDCRRIRQAAETHRAALAKLWLGKELTGWSRPCPIQVTLSDSRIGGATHFALATGFGMPAQVELIGTVSRILDHQLPHEVAHAVIAAHFNRPIPRWADEGVAIMCEGASEHRRYDKTLDQLITAGRAIRIIDLFQLKDYPLDMAILYSQGYSVTRYLVEKKDRATFLTFVASGMKDGWDIAAKSCYKFNSVTELERSWLAWFRDSQKSAAAPTVAPAPRSQ